MGKFKERYIEKSNQEFNENKIDFDGKKVLYQILESKNEITYEQLEEFGLYISTRLK
ncbi:hypothetical protein [Clostridium intestinale]|uniref:hypothetical protein n=1 Tax=Clostridium intestinale TaxID=36845 RepID=UPI000413018E|nr:hypothetical protein [Clostridium intestinale]